jgi:hypothetical protein
MIVLKHVEHKIRDPSELESLVSHLEETTSKVPGVTLQDIWFPMDRDEFVLLLDCTAEDRYLEWRDVCPPPQGARDWYEVFVTKHEYFA